MKVVVWSGKGRDTKPTLGVAFPSCPNNNFRHHEVSLPGAWWVFVVGGAHPHHKHFIHHITQLPCKGEVPVDILEGESSDLAIMEAMKKKYKLKNKKRGTSYLASMTKQ